MERLCLQAMKWGLAAGVSLSAAATIAGAQAQQPAPSYFEFGTVVAIAKHTVQIQVFDQRRQREVEHSFALSRETRADVVHVGDVVEVIYSTGAPADNAEYVLRRLVALHGDIPLAGPGPAGTVAAVTVPNGKGAAVPARQRVTTASNGQVLPGATVPNRTNANLGAAVDPTHRDTTAMNGAPVSVGLGSAARSTVPGVVNVPLGVSKERAYGAVPKATSVQQETPGAACHQNDPQWPAQPVSMAVLDFRYPTEREEAHDIGSTGGGSGTAVADIVYSRLGDNPQFQLSRGDREKVYRMDFAGAARVGRQLGVDAVILGTFAPVEAPNPDPDFPPPVTAYTLRAGVVDTCTGELLYRLTSISCAAAAAPGKSADAATCPGDLITAKAATDPEANVSSFQAPVRLLLSALDRRQPEAGDVGSVMTVQGQTVQFRTTGNVRAGDEVSVHALRLAKNPTTYTLHRYNDEEIGRVKVQRVGGGVAVGTFTGDVPPLVGDAVDRVPE